METQKTKSGKLRSPSAPMAIAALGLLFITNIVIAIVTLHSAHKTILEQIRKRMLDIGNTAANLINGDELRGISKEDIGSEKYDHALAILLIVQNNIDLDYIYLISSGEDGSFYYTIDPDPEAPAEFGMTHEITQALLNASQGKPDADDKPHTNIWGTFYSAYSPVYDSSGNVAGIIVVDYSTSRFISHLFKDFLIVSLLTLLSMIGGSILAVFVVKSSHKRFDIVNAELQSLSDGFEKIYTSIKKSCIARVQNLPSTSDNDLLKTLASGGQMEHPRHYHDEMSELTNRLHLIRNTMQHYLSYIESQTYLDPIAGVGNKIAYKKTLTELDAEIQQGKLLFAVGFFDINELRDINTQYGFEVGDAFLFETGAILKHIFQQKNVYRVASDEFIVILRGKNLTDMDGLFEKFDKEVETFNASGQFEARLSVSKGCSVHHPEDDTENYRIVFTHAEEAQRHNKERFHARQKAAEA